MTAIVVIAILVAVTVEVATAAEESGGGGSDASTGVWSAALWGLDSITLDASGTGINRLDSVALSTQHAYSAGLFNGAIDWGNGTVAYAAKPWATYLVKTTSQQAPLWLRAIDTNAASSPFPRVAFAAGDVFLAGAFSGKNVSFGPFLLSSSANVLTTFICRLSAAGVYKWAKQFDGNAWSGLGDMVVSGSAIYVVVNTRATRLTFGTRTLAFVGAVMRPTVWHLDLSGNVLSAIGAANGTTGDDRANAITFSAGVTYIAGSMAGTLRFGATPLLTAVTGTDLFIAATNGTDWRWALSAANTGADFWANGMSVLGSNLYIVGLYDLQATFGPLAAVTSSGGRDLFVVSVQRNTAVWRWVRSAGWLLNDYASAVISPNVDTILVTGSIRGNVTFGSKTQATETPSTEQIFVAGIDTAGAWVNSYTAKRLGGGQSQSEGLCLANNGDRYAIGGFYNGAMTFGCDLLESNVTTSFVVVTPTFGCVAL